MSVKSVTADFSVFQNFVLSHIIFLVKLCLWVFFLNPFSVVFVGLGKGTRLNMGLLCNFNPNPQEAF